MPALILLAGIVFAFFQEFSDLLRKREYRSLIFWAIATLLIGTVFYKYAEGWSVVDSLYFSIVTLATVGYGDLSPTTDGSKLFTVFYILFGLSLLTTFLHMLAKERQEIHEKRRRDHENLRHSSK